MKKMLQKGLMGLGLTALIGVAVIGSAFTGSYFELSKQLDIFTTLFKELNTYYVDDVEPGELMKTGIDAMLESLDPYTTYIPESEIEDFRFQTTGEYGGIGAIIRKKEDWVVISEPYEGSPADKAGLKAGDILLEIDGKSVKGYNTNQVSKILKGEAGTIVELKILREVSGEELDIEFERAEIQVECVPYYGMLDDHLGYIQLTSFTDKAFRDVKAAFKDLKENNELEGIVLDLRGNPGGLLREAVNICNLFIDKGEEVVFTRGKIKEWDKSYKALNDPYDLEIPVAVLVNRGSASASEIVSGTLQDLDRAVIIGTRTYGKGLVQQPRQLTYNAQLKVTIAKYYTPSGRCIQAINYGERDDDGSVKKIPDSLRTEFETRNGRVVLDGGGIEPDLEIENENLSDILRGLISKNVIFDFANQYAYHHPDAMEAKDFILDDAIYNEFVEYAKGVDFDFSTDTEKALKDLEEIAEDEQYLKSLEEQIEEMRTAIVKEKVDDLHRYRKQIGRYLRTELVLRYHYRKGQIENELLDDPFVEEAIRILHDANGYREILAVNQ